MNNTNLIVLVQAQMRQIIQDQESPTPGHHQSDQDRGATPRGLENQVDLEANQSLRKVDQDRGNLIAKHCGTFR